MANGGTGSATKNFVDLTTGQTVSGEKVFTDVLKIQKVDNQIVIDSSGIEGTLSWQPTTSNKIIEFPDKSGTVALLDDVPLDLTGTTSSYFTIDNDTPKTSITNSGLAVSNEVNPPALRYNGAKWQISHDGVIFIDLDTLHPQHTDTGTTSPTFTVNSGGSSLILDASSLSSNVSIAAEKIVTTDGTQVLTGKDIDGNQNTLTNIQDSSLSNNVVLKGNDQTISGVKTYDRPSGSQPFEVATAYTVGSTVTNLSADKLDGKDAPDGAIVGTTDTQTLTNKTLTNPFVNTGIRFKGASKNLSIKYDEPSLNRTVRFGDPGADDYIAYVDATQTLTNKTIDALKVDTELKLLDPNGDITVTWDSTSPRNIIVPDASGTLCLVDHTQALTNKTITSPTNHISASIIDSGTLPEARLTTNVQTAVSKAHDQHTDTHTDSSTFIVNNTGNKLILDSAALQGDRVIQFPDQNDKLVGEIHAAELENKTIDGNKNTIFNLNLTSAVIDILPIANGGTGSSTRNFVDITSDESIDGTKTFIEYPFGPSINPTDPEHIVTKRYVDQSIPAGSHDQNTDEGTTQETFTINTTDSAAQYVNLDLYNGGVNNRGIRLNKNNNQIELQKSDGSYVSVDSLLTTAATLSKHVHVEAVASAQWIINHSLSTEDVTITIYDDSPQRKVMYAETIINGPGQVVINFENDQAGKAVLTG